MTAVNRDSYLVRNEHNEVLAELTGRLSFSADSNGEFPCVGDWVLVQYYNADTFAIIHGVFPITDCTHTSEIGCSVLLAVENGELSEDRYRSYLKLLNESEYYQMSYVEKRKKDREFGKFIKSAMKHHRKK